MNLFCMSGTPYATSGLVTGLPASNPAPYVIPPAGQPYFYTKISMSPSSNVPVFFDCTWSDMPGTNVTTPLPSTTVVQPPPNFTTAAGNNNLQRTCLNRHGAAVNVAFKDGSAANVKLKLLWDLQWNKKSTPQSQNVTARFPVR